MNSSKNLGSWIHINEVIYEFMIWIHIMDQGYEEYSEFMAEFL